MKEITFLQTHYPARGGVYCAKALNRSAVSINHKAYKLGLKTSFNEGQFKKGECRHPTPAGTRRSPSTEFQPGQGVEKRKVGVPYWLKRDGYMVKPAQGAKPIPYNIHLWQQAHGPVPPGHVVRFIDGDRRNCTLDNLRCVSRAEHARLTFQAMSKQDRQKRGRQIWRSRDRNMRQRLGLPSYK